MKNYIYILIATSLLISCGGNEAVEETVVEEVVENEITPERASKAQLIFKTVPSPLETALMFQDAGASYNSENTNPIENVDKYVTNTQKALNLGVYGADLSYANIFDQSQESMFYMNCAKKMADGLDITSAFDAVTMERIEENMNNRDSLMTIINDAFWVVDAHLKENGQDNLSALIIAGGWLEGLYLGTKTLNAEAPDEGLMLKIAEQKYSLANLMGLLQLYENAEVKVVKEKMTELQIVFNKIEEVENETTVSEKDGVATIGGGSTLNYDKTIIEEITVITEKIRNEIIQ